MRLTLRTLLAYLDDVLDPADKEELAQKIESSDFAVDLVHKTRDTVRRLRLSAPQLIGHGMGLDPNSVAEYLDNVMPPDAVGDFERICLESEMHLAEAAACHHVLTMVLGQPADVDPLARQRMYTIASDGERKQLRLEPAHTAAASFATTAAPGQPVAAPAVARQEPRAVEIPEYLRTGPWWRSWSVLAGIAALLLIGVTVLLATGLLGGSKDEPPVTARSIDTNTSSAEKDLSNATEAEQAASNAQNEKVAGANEQSLQPVPPISPPQQPITAAPPTQPPPQPVTRPGEPERYAVSGTTRDASTAAVPPIAGNGTTPPAEAPAVAGASTNSGVAPQSVVAEPGAQVTPPGEATANVPSTPALPPQSTKALPPSTGEAGTTPPSNAVAAGAAPVAPAAPELDAKQGAGQQAPSAPLELGTYMGGKTVLLRFDGKTGAWFRVEARAAVMANMQLLSLPEFRPRIAMVSGLQLDMSGGTLVVIGGVGEAKSDDFASPEAATPAPAVARIPTVELIYGRIVLTNSSNGDNRVRLKLGPATGKAQLGRNATLAVAVERKHVPGQDPRQAAVPIECRIFAPDGGIVWKDAAGTKTVEKRARWTVSIAGATDPVDDPSPPDWIYQEPIGQLSDQRYGAPKIETALVSNIPADTQLLELFQSSKERYVKSLVTRSSIHVGLFVPFVEALRDSDQKANWKSHIDTLRAAMALSPESANKVWQTLVDQRGRPAAKDLYEMLCGYNAEQIGRTPDQVKTGAVATLIDWLEQDSLDYRVLAVHDLAEITGKRLMTNPAANASERMQSIRKWRARLEAGDLKPVSQPQ